MIKNFRFVALSFIMALIFTMPHLIHAFAFETEFTDIPKEVRRLIIREAARERYADEKNPCELALVCKEWAGVISEKQTQLELYNWAVHKVKDSSQGWETQHMYPPPTAPEYFSYQPYSVIIHCIYCQRSGSSYSRIRPEECQKAPGSVKQERLRIINRGLNDFLKNLIKGQEVVDEDSMIRWEENYRTLLEQFYS